MYCSSCGAAISEGLSYCKRCGAKLNDARNQIAGIKSLSPDSLIWGTVAVFVVGLGSTIGMTAAMKGLGLNEGFVNAMALLTFALTATIEAILVWLLVSRIRSGDERSTKARRHSTQEMDQAHPLSLPEPTPSVTENTTRSFNRDRVQSQ